MVFWILLVFYWMLFSSYLLVSVWWWVHIKPLFLQWNIQFYWILLGNKIIFIGFYWAIKSNKNGILLPNKIIFIGFYCVCFWCKNNGFLHFIEFYCAIFFFVIVVFGGCIFSCTFNLLYLHIYCKNAWFMQFYWPIKNDFYWILLPNKKQ